LRFYRSLVADNVTVWGDNLNFTDETMARCTIVLFAAMSPQNWMTRPYWSRLITFKSLGYNQPCCRINLGCPDCYTSYQALHALGQKPRSLAVSGIERKWSVILWPPIALRKTDSRGGAALLQSIAKMIDALHHPSMLARPMPRFLKLHLLGMGLSVSDHQLQNAAIWTHMLLRATPGLMAHIQCNSRVIILTGELRSQYWQLHRLASLTAMQRVMIRKLM